MSVGTTQRVDQRVEQPYRDAFLAILHGRGPYRATRGVSGGTGGGFLVIARNTRSLQELQAICAETDAPPGCLTARYRIQSGPAVGTLIAAFASDLRALMGLGVSGSPPPPPSGDLLPAVGPNIHGPWERLFASSVLIERLQSLKSAGQLDKSWLTDFFRELGLGQDAQSASGPLVLFGEVEDAGSIQDWADATTSVLPLLPNGVGIVMAGAPKEFRTPIDSTVNTPDGGRYVEFEVPDIGPSTEDVLRYTEAALSGDQTAKRDRLNVGRYAAALSRLVLLPETKPLTIGIQGPWGSGKSSFMELIRQELIEQAAEKEAPALRKDLEDTEHQLQAKEHEMLLADGDRQKVLDAERAELDERREGFLVDLEVAARRRVIPVFFNAWLYENATQIWAGLAAAITSRLEQTIPFWLRVRIRIAYALRLRGSEFWIGFVAPVIATVAIGGLLFVTGLGLRAQVIAQNLPSWLDWLSNVLPLAPALVTIAFIAWRFYLLARPLGERVAGYVGPRNYRERLGFQHQVLDDLQYIRTAVSRRFHPGPAGALARARAPIVVVFVDDLDRCSQDHIMEILQAINLILGASDFFVFLGIDTDMIYRAIADHYHLEADSPQMESFPSNYLRKIIQLSFYLPATSPAGRFAFVSQLFSANARGEHARKAAAPSGGVEPLPEVHLGPLDYDYRLIMPIRVKVTTNVVDTWNELKAFDDFKNFIEGNPRELKRLINVHRLTKILLQRSEASLTIARQRKLVEWLIFCGRWPDLVDDVMRCARDNPTGSDAIQQLIDRPAGGGRSGSRRGSPYFANRSRPPGTRPGPSEFA